ncbi:anhydro-N-acetylmuramic acid kinase [Aliifodinibius sp. S!AR15-10]|uniref:anhydro-N-acetylmuramic acid kinase n=1 Tax=Aliifodinibius sp. S!AR15-10 TaxID=2950437 RepID=UPI00286FDDF0|nr:anhydro-N-acetylmuramic acid kinase [Aliifodinibius sp. S!AR15-10]
MNQSIQRLSQIGSKSNRKIIGLMSGTSLDGLDIALCEVKGAGGETELDLLEFKTCTYSESIVKRLGPIVSRETVSLQEVCLANSWLANLHADLVLETLGDWQIEPEAIDAIASHGQTIYHAPFVKHKQKGMPNATLQVGDGDHIARKTGILTLSDFRQKHTAAGGEGAPLASIVDRQLYSHPTENRFLLNIGGIANFSFLPAEQSEAEYVTTDSGPGNTMINAIVQKHFNKDYDRDGEIAEAGKVKTELLAEMKRDSYFKKPFPKTTGPELFNLDWIEKKKKAASVVDIDPQDLVATVTWLSAESIADAIRSVANKLEEELPPVVYLSGGGMHNDTMMKWLRNLLENMQVESFEVIGYNPDAKEAASFAVLANEMLAGDGFLINPKRGVSRRVNFGKISFPV